MFVRARLFVLTLSMLLSVSPNRAWSASFKALFSFSNRAQYPNSNLVFDASGNAYGTTEGGGKDGRGTVYQLSPTSGFHIIYSFHGPDGRQPQGHLALDADGNLYGTTADGGHSQGCGVGCGTVFKLSPPIDGGVWTETVLYNFMGKRDGSIPVAGVVFDNAGNLYGTTQYGGSSNCGIVFELTSTPSGWTENILYKFSGSDGCRPISGVVFDLAGNIYSTTANGGLYDRGIVYELSPNGSAPERWTFTLVHTFDTDGIGPAGVILDRAGNLYGTTGGGGLNNDGMVYELTPGLGDWTETILYSFSGPDGQAPAADLISDRSGNFYGTTYYGGNGIGTIFELIRPAPGDEWSERSFALPVDGHLGANPTSPLTLEEGNLYGVISFGGKIGPGVAFQITH